MSMLQPNPYTSCRPVAFVMAHAKKAEDARQLRAPAMKRGRVDGLRELGDDA